MRHTLTSFFFWSFAELFVKVALVSMVFWELLGRKSMTSGNIKVTLCSNIGVGNILDF